VDTTGKRAGKIELGKQERRKLTSISLFPFFLIQKNPLLSVLIGG
jgi:hypothetical protein